MRKHTGSGMNSFIGLQGKIQNWQKDAQSPFAINGPSFDQWSYILTKLDNKIWRSGKHLIVTSTIEQAEEFCEHLERLDLGVKVFLFPGLEHSPYSGILASESSLLSRFQCLDFLTHCEDNFFIVTTWEAASMKLPPQSFFKENKINLEISDIAEPYELAKQLVELGYTHSTSVEEPGSFVQKGEIFDIFPLNGSPFRLHYFDDMIEEIFEIDPDNQRTLKDRPLEKVTLGPMPQVLSQSTFSNILRSHIPMPKVGQKEKFEKRKRILSQLSNGQMFEGYASAVPLFFENPVTLTEFINNDDLNIQFLDPSITQSNLLEFSELMRSEFDHESNSAESLQMFPDQQAFYQFESFQELIEGPHLHINSINIDISFDEDLTNKIDLTLESTSLYLRQHINPTLSKPDFFKEFFQFLLKEYKLDGRIVFTYNQDNTRKEIEHLLELADEEKKLSNKITFEKYHLQQGFYYQAEKLLVVSDSDLFSYKRKKTQKVKEYDYDLFAEQIATLKEGDYVIHTEHGLGIYKGLESLNLGASESDFLVIHYANNDKVYVPVYKMNLIQKHADGAAELKPDNLRSNKFSQLKVKAKNSIKKLAFDLLKLQAERESAKAFSFSAPDHLYKEFELAFPFQETPDQEAAIDRVLKDMQKTRPMDHLVCGDVGFGKTEVAMRAAFKAVEDNKQVAILVPTTVLALQHYNSFVKRFKDFPVRIDFLSRFKSPKDSKVVKEKLHAGELDIVIGTHKLLSDSIKYKDLGLVIVDEEQRFGVGHKEKLKLLKASVDFLTLTATPIPRTMQLAFLGLRDLSLIKTAPPKRQSIKSYIIKDDAFTLQNAIRKELSRGGQVFIVHNRVNDIEIYGNYIRELVPDAKIVICHGQLSEKEIESRMRAFIEGKYDILLATTIIESGIDIPNANTMIIDKANMYGLAQLHQLRGRIGRSDKKAYCYFIIPNTQNLTPLAERRLKALQTYADMGSGFNIASSDLEIRGAGDILGGEQSGHIECIGLELYMELLKEEINELKGAKEVTKRDIEISTPYSAYIPNNYIHDAGERLKQYKRLSNIIKISGLETKREEFQDIYGLIPQELENLFHILEARCHLQKLALKSVQLGGSTVNLKFDQSILENNEELRTSLINFFMQSPRKYQFSPTFDVLCNFKKPMDLLGFVEFSKELGQQILPC